MPSIVFKEWLPDQPKLGNGGLIKAENVLPIDGVFKPYLPLAGTSSAIAGVPLSAYRSRYGGNIYAAGVNTAGSAGLYYEFTGSAWTAKSANLGAGAAIADFDEFDDLLIATDVGNGAMCVTIGSASQFTTLALTGTNPLADHIAVIGRFVMAGTFANAAGGTTNSYVRWSSINDPRDWPTPNSATAIARQSGEQWLDSQFGKGTSIVGGDQFGLIFQTHGINRVTYAGPPVVFQFDNFEAERGAFFENATVKVSNLVYFVSDKGFFMTDGVSVKDIGDGKVSQTFLAEVDFTYPQRMSAAIDAKNGLIYWAYPTAAASANQSNKIITYNFKEGRWATSNQVSYALFSGGTLGITPPAYEYPMGFQASRTVGSFVGTAGSAVIETGESELFEGMRAYVDAVKPHVESSGTAPSIGVRIGTRDDLGTTPSYTSTTGPTTRTGFCDFRSDAKYHRFEVNITGNFEKVTGLEFNAQPSGSA